MLYHQPIRIIKNSHLFPARVPPAIFLVFLQRLFTSDLHLCQLELSPLMTCIPSSACPNATDMTPSNDHTRPSSSLHTYFHPSCHTLLHTADDSLMMYTFRPLHNNTFFPSEDGRFPNLIVISFLLVPSTVPIYCQFSINVLICRSFCLLCFLSSFFSLSLRSNLPMICSYRMCPSFDRRLRYFYLYVARLFRSPFLRSPRVTNQVVFTTCIFYCD